MFRSLILAVGSLTAVATGSMFANADGNAPIRQMPALSAPAPSADALDDGMAAAVIGSVARQFDTDDVTVTLDEVRIAPASVQDREVLGTGRLRIDGDGQWIPFRVAAIYDTASAEVTYPRLTIGAPAAAAAPADAVLARALDRQVSRALHAEFAGQPVSWMPGTATMAAHGQRFVHVQGQGVADFGPEGDVPARVDALYDSRSGRWLRVTYSLGDEDAEPPVGGEAIAAI